MGTELDTRPVAGTRRATFRETVAQLRADVRTAWDMPGVRRGFLGTCLIASGSMTPAFLPPDAPIVTTLHLTFLERGPGRFIATAVLMVGVVLLLFAWLSLRPTPGHRTAPSVTWAIWGIPFLLAPPLFSRDAYSYAAQGLVVARGMDPYQVGPIGVPGPYADQVDTLWLYTAAPYGPVALQTQHFFVWLTNGNAYAASLSMRLPALLSVAVIAYALPRLAERVGVSRQQAVWFGVLNPVVMMHLVGGVHQDAMMVALVVLGLLMASHGHLIIGSALVAGGASYKQTAVLALIGVAALAVRAGARQNGRVVTHTRYLIACAISGVVALVTFELLTLATGLGWGWVPNLSVPAMLRSLLSPPTLIGQIFEWIMVLLGMPRAWTLVPVPLMQSVGGLLGVLTIAYLALRVAPRRPMAAASGAFLALCLGGPVIHPWYMLWGGVLLGATRVSRRWAQVSVWVTTFFVLYSTIDAAFSNGVWALGLTAAAWTVWRIRTPQAPPVEWHPTRQGQVTPDSPADVRSVPAIR